MQFTLKTYSEPVNQRLGELLPDPSIAPAHLHEAMRYACLADGKRLRPALCIVSCEAFGGTLSQALDAACALEMVHAFSLIHDDLPALDNDDLRRGKPTVHRAFDEATAILAGDALFALAFQTLANIGASPLTKARCIARLAVASGSRGLAGGEALDLASEGKPVTVEDVTAIHLLKTAALISASCVIGALLAGASDEDVEIIASAGRRIGVAFQIRDDVLNEVADSHVTGKAKGSDRDRLKATYPRAIGVESSEEAAAAEIALAMYELDRLSVDTAQLRELARLAVHRLS